jgi:DNA polymerase-3 subunit delta
LKRLIELHLEINNKKNIDIVISSYKPPIFWKEKDVVKQQIKAIKFDEAKTLMVKGNEIELLMKKNPQFSVNITTDFIINSSV